MNTANKQDFDALIRNLLRAINYVVSNPSCPRRKRQEQVSLRLLRKIGIRGGDA